MGKKWDTTGNFYDWCNKRAVALHRVIKSGGYVLIFGHPKTNHRMKCAFEDAGFNIVEEIDWVYGTGFPKNQDIGKLFDKKAGAEREVVGVAGKSAIHEGGYKCDGINVSGGKFGGEYYETTPTSDLAKQWNGYKTAGLKPAHEPITVFQKPLEGTYINNIEKYNCGGMNIDACRVPTEEIITNHSRSAESAISKGIYHDSKAQETHQTEGQQSGRFPANMIFDSSMGEVLDNQSGECFSGSEKYGINKEANSCYWTKKEWNQESPKRQEGVGASRYFLKIDAEDFVPFLYCAKPSKKEKGEGNIHVTVKPKELIKWLIKLVTPVGGKTIDITAGSGTHGLACEELNRDENYNLHWLNIEMLNTEKEPYCEIAKKRIEHIL